MWSTGQEELLERLAWCNPENISQGFYGFNRVAVEPLIPICKWLSQSVTENNRKDTGCFTQIRQRVEPVATRLIYTFTLFLLARTLAHQQRGCFVSRHCPLFNENCRYVLNGCRFFHHDITVIPFKIANFTPFELRWCKGNYRRRDLTGYWWMVKCSSQSWPSSIGKACFVFPGEAK